MYGMLEEVVSKKSEKQELRVAKRTDRRVDHPWIESSLLRLLNIYGTRCTSCACQGIVITIPFFIRRCIRKFPTLALRTSVNSTK